ncbi:MAG: hypothetical protein US72_C0006G0023 [Microgenomates group bacterium GW2011_GWC1_38_12]|nr:MAG: hypothetical protein US72_C0006G0023 [Microgenomates group bacterium GW2011_GWC1_38_12]
MREIEVKFKIKNYNIVRDRVKASGAKFWGKFKQSDVFYDTKENKLKSEKSILRLRKSNSKTFLTYKDDLVINKKFREAREIEIQIDSFKKTEIILKLLGLNRVFHFIKYRETWKQGNVEINLDKIKDLGNFLELEGPKLDIDQIIKRLRLEKLKRITKHYGQLLEKF